MTPEAFWTRVSKGNDCWEWTATVRKGSGYGQAYYKGGVIRAHRLSWIINVGEIPAGRMVLHRCDNRKCVRPSHLFLGGAKENMVDCASKNRNWQQKKTHCPQGHEYTPENTYWQGQKGYDHKFRYCAVCTRARVMARKRRLQSERA